MMQTRKCNTDAEVLECIKDMIRQIPSYYKNPKFTVVSEKELIVTFTAGKRLMDIKFEFYIIDGALDEINLESVINYPFNEMDFQKIGELEAYKDFSDSIDKERSRISVGTDYDDGMVYVRGMVPTVVFALANLHHGVTTLVWNTKNLAAQLGATDVEGVSCCY